MKSVNSAFWLALQGNALNMAELITLQLSNNTYRWTTSNAQIVSSGYTYDPFPGMSGKGSEESTDLGIGTVDFSAINSGDLAPQLMANGIDRAPVSIRLVMVDTPDLGTLWLFQGKIGDLTFDRANIGGQARNIFNGVAARFPYYTYQDYCVWRFGSQGCGFNTSSITLTGSLNVSSSTPLILVATSGTIVRSYGSNALSRGRVTIASGANSGQVRTIRANTGDMFALSHALPYAVESGGVTFSLYPGCRKRLINDCKSLYNNTQNFFGFPWIPKQQYAF